MRVLHARGIESEAECRSPGCWSCCVRRSPRSSGSRSRRRTRSRARSRCGPRSAQDRFAVGAATLSLLAAHAEEGPVAVLVDDAHWLDGSSAEALLFALRRLVADPIAVILAVRDDEPSLLDGADLPTLRSAGLDRVSAAAELARRRCRRSPSVSTARRPATRSRCWSSAPTRRGSRELPARRADRRSSAGHRARIPARARRRFPRRTRRALVLAAASDTGELSRRSSAPRRSARVDDLAACGGRGPGRAARRPRRVPSRARAIGGVRRGAARGAARGAPRACRRAAGPRCRPPRLAPRARDASARTTRRRRRSSRPARARASGARTPSRQPRSSARRALSLESPAPLLYAAADAAWLGGQADRAVALLDERAPARTTTGARHPHRAPARPDRGAARAGQEAHAILAAAAERAAPTDPERPS